MPDADVSHARLLRAVQPLAPKSDEPEWKSEDYSEFLICSVETTLCALGKGRERLGVCKETQLWRGGAVEEVRGGNFGRVFVAALHCALGSAKPPPATPVHVTCLRFCAGAS